MSETKLNLLESYSDSENSKLAAWRELLHTEMSRLMTKPTKWFVRAAKTQISLGTCPVWSESLLCAQWVAKDPIFLHADSEDSDQTGQMHRLTWVFTGRTCHFVGFVINVLTIMRHQMGPQLKLPIWGNNSIHALSVLQTCFIVSCFGIYGIGPSICLATPVIIKLLSQLQFSLPPYFIFFLNFTNSNGGSHFFLFSKWQIYVKFAATKCWLHCKTFKMWENILNEF